MSHLKDDPGSLTELKIGQDSARESAIRAGLGGVLGYLGGVVVALVIGVGTVFLAGPIGGLFAGAALGSFVGAMAGLGIRHEHIGHYENCIKDGKVLVIAHGDTNELGHAKQVLSGTDATEVQLHSQNGLQKS